MSLGPVYRIYRDRAGGWRWRFVAANGEKTAASEAYTRKADAVRAARRQRESAATARIEVCA